ncbi:hypothetical protein [Bradyrhizobium sp. 145]|uniref:hypothetical protein n=1 Tax=Bradyrhizobium sp. 145 TaxID=2782621 RepID=UPI001FFBA7AF|nr:hypothetical protein [Bradyrhizobium sp. 145]MCK1687960.1 hypothetical protein [Bradyrhizobium sp. 145]
MEQKDELQSLSTDELWSLREEVDSKLATIILKRRCMLEERLAQPRPRQVEGPSPESQSVN